MEIITPKKVNPHGRVTQTEDRLGIRKIEKEYMDIQNFANRFLPKFNELVKANSLIFSVFRHWY
ncbi:hypothetical protein DDT91_17145 [Algoriphagus sp. AK58]|nr:hypothetical protein [Algoriphagus sp. AK58]